MLDNIYFHKFKQFKDETIPLRKGVSFIAGGNNSGKTTILQGLAVWEFCRAVIEAEKGTDAVLMNSKHQGWGLGDDEFSPIRVPSLKHLWTNLYPQKTSKDNEKDGYTLRIKCSWQNDSLQKELEFGLSLANDRLFIKTTSSNLQEGERIPRIAYLPPFAGMTDHEALVAPAIRRRRIGEGLAGAVLRNTLLDLYEENIRKRKDLRQDKTKITDSDLKELRKKDPWELLQQALRSTFNRELYVSPFKKEYHSHIKIEVPTFNIEVQQMKQLLPSAF